MFLLNLPIFTLMCKNCGTLNNVIIEMGDFCCTIHPFHYNATGCTPTHPNVIITFLSVIIHAEQRYGKLMLHNIHEWMCYVRKRVNLFFFM
jgi:hypothetical protein